MAQQAQTAQQKMQALLAKTGIPAKQIHCYGMQVVVTCWGRDAAEKFSGVLSRFCSKVSGPVQSYDHNQVNTNTVLKPSGHIVWLVAGTI